MTQRQPLAILGGTPAFAEPLHVGRPNIGDREKFRARMDEILDRRWLTNAGPVVLEFEDRLRDYLGVRHCIPVCNGTIALELAIRALELTGEVIVPSSTFVATAHALQWQEITPAFVDIDAATFNIDPAAVEARITPYTTGIIGVHLWGRPCNVPALEEIAARHGLALLFDAAHAFGCTLGGRRVGGFGNAEVFSFHATKVFNTFEGGAIATNDDKLAAKLRLMKNFGFAGFDNVVSVGTNGKMTEACAAMGLVNLESLDAFIAANRRNYGVYREELARIPGTSAIPYDASESCNWQYVVVVLDELRLGISRDALVKALHAENVIARRYFFPGAHRMAPYSAIYPDVGRELPVTERMLSRIVSLPNGTAVSADTARRVVDVIARIVENAPAVMAAVETA